MSDRRVTYRAVLAETREAELCVGRYRHPVSIVEESSGGLCVAAVAEPPVAAGDEAQLFTDDGDCLRVEIMHVRNGAGMIRVGLRRIEPESKDIRRRMRRHTSPFVLLTGLTLGLYAGFAVRLEPVRGCLAQLPSLSQYF